MTEPVAADFDRLAFYAGLEKVAGLGREANRFFHLAAPWKLAKEPVSGRPEAPDSPTGGLEGGAGAGKAEAAVHGALEALRVAGHLLQPVVPGLAARLLTALAVPPPLRALANAGQHMTMERGLLGPAAPLVPRDQWRERNRDRAS